MIEREFIAQKTKEHYIKQYIESKLDKVGISSIRLKKIPLGEKIIVDTSRPSLIVGSKGSNIKELTKVLKKEFKLENPQIEINEVKNIWLDANIVAERIAGSLERFGSARFKGIGHKTMENVMRSGAMGVEIVISGKVPSTRAKTWRFSNGYLKKCGDVAIVGVKRAQTSALLKSGILGIKVAIMPPDLILPDHVEILEEPEQVTEQVTKKVKEEKTPVQKTEDKTKKSNTKKKTTKKKVAKNKPVKKEESVVDKVIDAVEKAEEKVEEVVKDVVEKVEEVLHIKKDEEHKKKSHSKKEDKKEEETPVEVKEE